MKLTPEDAGRLLASAMDGQIEQVQATIEAKRTAARKWIEDIIEELAKAREEGIKQGLAANPHDLARTVLALRGGDWTTTKPAVPGWYWGYRPCDMCGPENQVIPIRCHPGTGDPPVVTAPNGYGELREVTHFFGPLAVPEPPEEDPGQHD